MIEKAMIVLWQSRLFTVPKKDSPEERLILDLSILNDYIKRPHFKMLTIKEVKLLLPRGYWTVSIDLKDGFWHVPVSRGKRPYLGFRWKKQNWQFRAMPFGLNVAPRIFTKLIAHVVKVMAEVGIWCLPYLCPHMTKGRNLHLLYGSRLYKLLWLLSGVLVAQQRENVRWMANNNI